MKPMEICIIMTVRNLPYLALLLAAAALFLAGCGDDAGANNGDDDDGGAQPMEEARAEVGNEICPSSGNPVREHFYAVHNGWKVHFFCPNCLNSFVEDPEQYADRIEELTGHDIRVPAPHGDEEQDN